MDITCTATIDRVYGDVAAPVAFCGDCGAVVDVEAGILPGATTVVAPHARRA